ncbi:MAG TPA: hypothetical protein VM261_14200 [Kofleriaceae bacterium]|nr:hypothetical protein [Kofleriaceae bacterium]
MKTASLPLLLFSVAAATASSAPSVASAGVRVEVDPGAPFTEADLADAVEIRTAEPQAASAASDEVVIRVAKLGMDQLVVIVGDRSQVVTLDDHDRAASSRVVALVVTALLDDGRTVALGPTSVPAVETAEPVIGEVAHAPAPLPRTAFLGGGAITRDDNGYVIALANLGVARPIAPHVRLVGTLGFGQYDGYLNTHATLFPLRVGFEGGGRAAAIEIGGELVNYRESSCGAAEWGHATGVYGAGKVFLPVGARSRIVGELGGHFVGSVAPTACNSGPNYTSYGGWLGAGLEWTP